MAYSHSKVESRGNISLPKADPWSKRYVSGSQTPDLSTPSPSCTSSYRSGPAQKDRALATNTGLGIGLASSVRRDLNDSSRMSTSSTGSSSTVIEQSSRYSDASAPTFTSPDGVLSKVVGSLVDPENSRQKWSCFSCNTVFARDTTIYVSPASASSASASGSPDKQTLKPGGEYFCKNCYTVRFAIANCHSVECGKPILGSTKEDGKFIKVSNGVLYHGKCFKCVWCGKSKFKDGIEIMIGISGDPVCEDDFSKSGKKRESLQTAYNSKGALTKTKGEGKEADESLERKMMSRPNDQSASSSGLTRSESSKKRMGNSIAELSKRFSGSVSATSSPIMPTSPRSPTMSSPSFKTQEFSLIQGTSKPANTSLSPRGGVLTTNGSESGPPISNSRSQEKADSYSDKDSDTYKKSIPNIKPSSNQLSLSPHIGKSPSFERFFEQINRPPSIASLNRTQSSDNSKPDLTRLDSFEKSRSRSPTRPRPLTAEFSSGKFNLANYRPSGLERKDSRSRSVSPVKIDREDRSSKCVEEGLEEERRKRFADVRPEEEKVKSNRDQQGEDEEIKCTICHRGPFDAPGFGVNKEGIQEVQIVTLSGGINLHSSCFKCALCQSDIDPRKSFVRLSASELPEAQLINHPEDRFNLHFAHPQCAPIPKLDRPLPSTSSNLAAPISAVNTGGSYASSSGANDHATHQRAPRPSKSDGLDRTPPVTLYGAPPISHSDLNSMSRSLSKESSLSEEKKTSRSPSPNRFKRPISPSKLSSSSLFSSSTSAAPSTSMSGRNFQSTSGAAPPTRSTINVRRTPFAREGQDSNGSSESPISRNPAAGFFSKLNSDSVQKSVAQSSSSSSATSRFGGLTPCAGCGTKLSSLESVPGPRGTSWHRSCLVCKSKPVKKDNHIGYSSLKKVEEICGKKLDSGAKVTIEGEVRCRDCFDRERKQGGIVT